MEATGPREGLAIVIATRNRPHLLENCIRAFSSSRNVRIVLVIDSSDEDEFRLGSRSIQSASESNPKLILRHIQHPIRSLTHQKNRALETLDQTNVAAFQVIDDDVLIRGPALDAMFEVLMSRPDCVGISGVTEDSQLSTGPKSWKHYLDLVTGLTSGTPGRISMGGCGVPARFEDFERTLQIAECEWLIGCSMFKFEAVQGLRYEERFTGSGLFEDVDYSLRVGQLGTLLATNILIEHQLESLNRPDQRVLAQRFAQNRHLICSRLGMPNLVAFWFGTIVLCTMHGFLSPFRRSSREWLGGTLQGVLGIFTRTWPQ